jgi:hypothetical protein
VDYFFICQTFAASPAEPTQWTKVTQAKLEQSAVQMPRGHSNRAMWIYWGERKRPPNSRFERLTSEGPRLRRGFAGGFVTARNQCSTVRFHRSRWSIG